MCGFYSKIIYDKDGSFGDIMVMSLRYTLGRHTYAVKEVCDFIKENKVHIDNRVKSVILKDLETYLKAHEFDMFVGAECDTAVYKNLFDFLTTEV